jgi:hypothetical protein
MYNTEVVDLMLFSMCMHHLRLKVKYNMKIF